MAKQDLLESITNHYLESPDFNGYPLRNIGNYDTQELEELISEELVEAVSFDDCLNPYIRAYNLELSFEAQVLNITKKEVCTVLFPTGKALFETPINPAEPYTALLIRGQPQYKIIYFEPQIVEIYLLNPKYQTKFHGYRGEISVKVEHYNPANGTSEYVRDFGMAYKHGDKLDRAIGVFLCDLAKLSSKQQMRWRSYEIEAQGTCTINERFKQDLVTGEWGNSVWIFDALLLEMETINKLCNCIGIPPLFKITIKVDCDEKPIGYQTILLPTKRHFDEFVLAVEKIVINNLNPETFLVAAPFVTPVGKKDVDEREKGSLILLEEWLTKNTIPKDSIKPLVIVPLRKVRKTRQKPAHAIRDDDYNIDYYQEQVEIIRAVYHAVAAIRVRLAKHPCCRNVTIPPCLLDVDRIVMY